MKHLLLFVALLASFYAPICRAATGDITAISINTGNMNGSDAYVTVSGFVRGGTQSYGLDANNNPITPTMIFTVTSPGYDQTGSAVNYIRTVYGTVWVRYAYPPNYINAHSYNCGDRVSGSAHDQYQTVLGGCTSRASGTPAWSTTGGSVADGGGGTCTWLDAGASPIPNVISGIPDANTCTAGALTLRVALSDFIYPGETVIANVANTWYHDNGTGGSGNFNNTLTNFTVTNNSTLAYPVSVCRNVTVPFQLVSAAFTVEALCVSRWARNASEVAVMVFTVSDAHGHSNTTAVTQMTKSSWEYGDPNTVTDYAALMSVAGLTNGDVLTVSFKAYPWIGQSGQVVDSSTGTATPGCCLGPMKFFLDTNSSFTGTFGTVDTTSGVAAPSPGFYTTQSAAEAAYNGNHALAFDTLAHASAAAKVFNNSTYGAGHNDAGCSTILYPAGSTYTLTYNGSDLGTMNCWLIVTHLSNVTSQTGVTFTTGGSMLCKLCAVKDVSLVASSGTSFISGAATTVAWLHHNILNIQQTSPILTALAVYPTQNTIPTGGSLSGGFYPFSNTKIYFPLIRGNVFNSIFSTTNQACAVYAVIGNKNCNAISFDIGNIPTVETTDLPIIAFNTQYGATTQVNSWAANAIVTGWGVLQNVFETVSGGSTAMTIAGDSSGQNAACSDGTNYTLCPVNNVIIQHNLTVGGRCNLAYANFSNNGSGGSPVDLNFRLNWSMKFSVCGAQGTDAGYNNKTDTFVTGPPDGTRINNWSFSYMAGAVGNVTNPNQIQFPPDFNGLGSLFNQTVASLGYVANNSQSGTGTGSGDYHISGSSTAVHPSSRSTYSDEVIPFDIQGTPRIGNPNAGPFTVGPGLSVLPGAVIFPKTVAF